MAVLLADERGAVIECNSSAEAMLRRPECPLRLLAGRLAAVSSGDTAALARAIATAACVSHGQTGAVPPVLRLAKTDGSGAIGVMVTPARRAGQLGMSEGRLILVFVSNPGQPPSKRPRVADLPIRPIANRGGSRGTARNG